jgi:hypothetical protein
MTNHKSHHIFIYLGILILLFALVFGMKYFKSLYNFDQVDVVVSNQSYDTGALTESPFVPVETNENEEVDPFTAKKKYTIGLSDIEINSNDECLFLGEYIAISYIKSPSVCERYDYFDSNEYIYRLVGESDKYLIYSFNFDIYEEFFLINLEEVFGRKKNTMIPILPANIYIDDSSHIIAYTLESNPIIDLPSINSVNISVYDISNDTFGNFVSTYSNEFISKSKNNILFAILNDDKNNYENLVMKKYRTY